MRNGELKLEVLVFYGVLFFTCVVGIIELLPEFDNWLDYPEGIGILYRVALSLLYFGLLLGTILSMHLSIRFYESEELPYRSLVIELFLRRRMRWVIVALISFVFISLYLVKAGMDVMNMVFVVLFIVVEVLSLTMLSANLVV